MQIKIQKYTYTNVYVNVYSNMISAAFNINDTFSTLFSTTLFLYTATVPAVAYRSYRVLLLSFYI